MMTIDDEERGLMKQDDDVDEYDGRSERDAQCHEVELEQEEFQFIFCLIIKYFVLLLYSQRLK